MLSPSPSLDEGEHQHRLKCNGAKQPPFFHRKPDWVSDINIAHQLRKTLQSNLKESLSLRLTQPLHGVCWHKKYSAALQQNARNPPDYQGNPRLNLTVFFKKCCSSRACFTHLLRRIVESRKLTNNTPNKAIPL